jgi:hypothetical protein
MYALAASAAGVGMLALGQSAEAKIIHTTTSKTIRLHQHYNLDLNHDGITDFTIQLTTTRSSSHFFFTTLGVLSPHNNEIAGGRSSTHGRGPYAFALQRGAVVGPKQKFPGKLMALAGTDDGFSVYVGQWLDVNHRYLGLKFQIHGKIHYGWARLGVISNDSSITSATLTEYAYETIVNKPIIAGDTTGRQIGSTSQTNPAARTPQSTRLGLLAVGSSGLSTWRTQSTR